MRPNIEPRTVRRCGSMPTANNDLGWYLQEIVERGGRGWLPEKQGRGGTPGD